MLVSCVKGTSTMCRICQMLSVKIRDLYRSYAGASGYQRAKTAAEIHKPHDADPPGKCLVYLPESMNGWIFYSFYVYR